MKQVPKVLQFSCPNCSIPLTVPESMAGITGPCPSCQSPVTAPELVQLSPPKTQLRPPFLVAALVASGLGLGWSVDQHKGGNFANKVVQARETTRMAATPQIVEVDEPFPPPVMQATPPAMQETILAATEAAPSSSGAAPLLSAGAKPTKPDSSTAANALVPKPAEPSKPRPKD